MEMEIEKTEKCIRGGGGQEKKRERAEDSVTHGREAAGSGEPRTRMKQHRIKETDTEGRSPCPGFAPRRLPVWPSLPSLVHSREMRERGKGRKHL